MRQLNMSPIADTGTQCWNLDDNGIIDSKSSAVLDQTAEQMPCGKIRWTTITSSAEKENFRLSPPYPKPSFLATLFFTSCRGDNQLSRTIS